MVLEILTTFVLGSVLWLGGMRLGRVLVRQGVTAANLFQGKEVPAVIFLMFYLGLLWLALYLPQIPTLPLEWRFYGMQITWTFIRLLLMGLCGIAMTISWQTARTQVMAVVLIGILGLGGFTSIEAYFLTPIYPALRDNLQPNGVFWQTSDSSCAPAALATVLRRWGIDATESSIARLAATNRMGTTMAQLIIAAQGVGMNGLELAPSWEQIQQINRLGVLAVWLFNGNQKLPHAVALMAINSEGAIIADPARGQLFKLDRPTFAKIWRQQYVPIFHPQEIAFSAEKAADYLHQLGYLKTPQGTQDLSSSIRQFQMDQKIAATGTLDPITRLLLSGPFLENGPHLRE